MSFSLGIGGNKGKTSSVSNLNQTVNLNEQQTGSTSSVTNQAQQQSSTEKAVQDILQSTQQNQQNKGSQKGTTSVSGGSTQQQNQANTDLTTLLGGDVQSKLTEAVLSLLDNSTGPEGSQALIDILSGNAKNAGTEIAASNAAVVDAARFSGEKELQALQTQLAQQAGGSIANTGVAAATAEGRASLESQLAGLQGQLDLQGRQTQAQELLAAIQGSQDGENQAVPLLDILKGSTQRQSGTASSAASGTQQQTQQQDIQTLAQVISDSISQTKGETTTTALSDLMSTATTEQQTQLQKLIEEITVARETSKGKSRGSNFSAGVSSAPET